MNHKLAPLVGELKDGLQTIYASRLKALYLFGSYARGDEQVESDVDVLVVLDRCDRYAEEIDRSSQLVGDLSLKYAVSLSRVFVSEEDWRTAETPFLVNAREEAVPV
jgi:predicted nucleotidyltransferase